MWIGLGVAVLAACGGDSAVRLDLDAAASEAVDSGDAAEINSTPIDTAPGETAAEIAAETTVDPTDSATPDTAPPSDTITDEGQAEATSDAEVADDAAPPADTELRGDAATPEASDASWPADRPHGQCARGSDCPGSLVCAESAPGGICGGCGTEPCPEGTVCNHVGACSRECTRDPECPAGMRCHGTQEVCVLVACDEDGDCTSPYVCDGGFCRRPSCATASCPAPFVCAGDVCVEPYFVP